MQNKPLTSGIFISFLIDKNIVFLFLIYIIFVLAISFLFSIIYSLLPLDYGSHDPTFANIYYYTLSTHFTVGFGDIHPLPGSRIIFIIHSIISYLLNTLLVGVIVVKMLWPKHILVLSEYILFDTIRNDFRIYLYNSHKFQLIGLQYNIFLCQRKESSKDKGHFSRTNYIVRLKKEIHPWINTHSRLYISTKKCNTNIESTTEKHIERGLILHPLHINKYSKIKIVISGQFDKIGGQSYIQTHTYKYSDILCGSFKSLKEVAANSSSTTQWKNFGEVDVTTADECNKCPLNLGCAIKNNLFDFKK